jgi:hypothetical protein
LPSTKRKAVHCRPTGCSMSIQAGWMRPELASRSLRRQQSLWVNSILAEW